MNIMITSDTSISVEFGSKIHPSIQEKVTRLKALIKMEKIPGMIETIPAFASLMIIYDPCILSFQELVTILEDLNGRDMKIIKTPKRIIEIPVCYGEEYGADFKQVLEYTQLSRKEFIRRHSAKPYLIYMMGFLPGFAYLGGLDESIKVPRLQQPRTRIEAGSVGIGGEQTGIYPVDSPGGWQLIGKTPMKLYDSEREQPFLYQAGDYIRFVSVDEERYKEIETEVLTGRYHCNITEE